MKKYTEAGEDAAYFIEQLDGAKRWQRDWEEKAKAITGRYRDERSSDSSDRKVNILWSTTESMQSALFTRIGQPDVRRKFSKPGKSEKTAKAAAIVLERALTAAIGSYDLTSEIDMAVQDRLLAGRGTVWIEFDADVGGDGSVKHRTLRPEHIAWSDFRHGSAKRWPDVPWVARKLLFSKDDIKDSFPEYAELVNYGHVIGEFADSKDEDRESHTRAEVWEVWDKGSKKRLYVADGCPKILKSNNDPYKLKEFFPTPKPLYAVTTSSSLIPVPEFTLWQDQANELDRVNTRIQRLLEMIKYAGYYNKNIGESDVLAELGRLEDGQFLPINGSSDLLAGGLSNLFMVRDIQPIITSLQALAIQRDNLIDRINQLTGLSDVMQGMASPYESGVQQEVKVRVGSQRFSRKKREVQDFICHLFRLMIEIIAEHFGREQLEEMSGLAMPPKAEQEKAKKQLADSAAAKAAQDKVSDLATQNPDVAEAVVRSPQMSAMAQQMMPVDPLADMAPDMVLEIQKTANAATWEDVSEILRSDERRNYEVQVETDATAFDDEEAEKANWLEFNNTLSAQMQQLTAGIQMNPAMGVMGKAIIMTTVRKFKGGRSMEDAIEEGLDALLSAPPAPPPVDPMVALQQKALEIEVQSKQLDLDTKRQLSALKIQEKQQELELSHEQLLLKQSALQMKGQEQFMKSNNQSVEAENKRTELEVANLKLQSKLAENSPMQLALPLMQQ